MKDRDTTVIPIRIKNTLIPEMEEAVKASRKPSRNAWIIWCIELGKRKHNKK